MLRSEPSARTTVIPNGIDEDPTASYGGEKKRRILVVTRMFEREGIQYFLRALQGMKLQHEVHIVGDGPYLPTLKALDEELGIGARLWGWLDRGSAELRNLYDSSEIYVFPSEAENFPLVLRRAGPDARQLYLARGRGPIRRVLSEAPPVAHRGGCHHGCCLIAQPLH